MSHAASRNWESFIDKYRNIFLTVFINIIVEWLKILTRTLKIIVFSAIVDTLCQCLTHASKLTVDSLCRDIIVDLSLYLFSLINTCVAYLFSVLWHNPHPLDWPSIWQHTIIISKYRLSRSTRLELSGKKSPEMSYDFFYPSLHFPLIHNWSSYMPFANSYRFELI